MKRHPSDIRDMERNEKTSHSLDLSRSLREKRTPKKGFGEMEGL